MPGADAIPLSIDHGHQAAGEIIPWTTGQQTQMFQADVVGSPKEMAALASRIFSTYESLEAAKKETILLKTDTNAFGLAFRAYEAAGKRQLGVENFYQTNHINQTYEFVLTMKAKHLQLNKAVMSIWDAALLLNETVDESDPDLDMPQIEHLLQTAEAIRREHPNEDWFHLIGFIHDLGKVLLHPSFGEEPQWAVVGDTYPVGCKFDPAIVHSNYFEDNPDSQNPLYNTESGVYTPGCGLDKVHISWSHDEYMYQVMLQNGCTIPAPGYYMVRYHSFYSLHQKGAYQNLMNDFDREMLPWILEFNKFDLYSKSHIKCDVETLKPYYMSLIEKGFCDTTPVFPYRTNMAGVKSDRTSSNLLVNKYFPNELRW